MIRFLPLFLVFAVLACHQATPEVNQPVAAPSSYPSNPPDPDFDLDGSDKGATALVDSIVRHHGGREAYDEARYFRWNFLGARELVWDKLRKRARITSLKDGTVYLLDYSGEAPAGRVMLEDGEVTDPDQLVKSLEQAHSALINDSYWLVHQFKLLDAGVTLSLLPEVKADPLAARPSYVLEQTFNGVGDTPENKYRLFVDKETYRINTWAFYRDADDAEAAFQTPWSGYREYGGLQLSGDRGERFQLTDISVSENVSEEEFTEF